MLLKFEENDSLRVQEEGPVAQKWTNKIYLMAINLILITNWLVKLVRKAVYGAKEEISKRMTDL